VEYDRLRPCPVYLCYASYKSEVSTKEFILWCLREGKTVYVPRVMTGKSAKSKEVDTGHSFRIADMAFYQIASWEELRAGYQGILEPEALPERNFLAQITESELTERTKTEEMPENKKEALSEKDGNLHFRMLLPGAVFDKSGNRIGYGGGFYDRWLAKWDQSAGGNSGALEKIGLAYQMQIVDAVPAEAFDRRAERIITEECIL